MRIIRNYIIFEILAAFFVCIFIFVFVLIAGRFVGMADLIINKGVSIFDISRVLLLLIPYMLAISIPMAFLTGCIFIFGRMSSDNEISALLSSGISFLKIIIPVIYLSVLISFVCLYIHDRVIPSTRFKSRQIIKSIGLKEPTAFLEPGIFIKQFEPYVIYIGEIKKGIMHRVCIYQPERGKPTRTIFARRAETLPSDDDQSVRLKLYNGATDEPNPNDPNSFYKIMFDEYIITLHIPEDSYSGTIEKKPREMTIQEIKNQIKELEAKSINTAPLSTEIQWKMSLSFACIPFAIIALPIAVRIRRAEKSIAFGISLLIILIYYLIFLLSQMLAIEGKIEPYFLWFANIMFTAAGILFINYENYR